MFILLIILSTFIILMLSLFLLFLSNKVSISKSDFEKNSAYECGFIPFDHNRQELEIHFYLIALLFLIFDLELSILLPFVIVFEKINYYAFFGLFIFGLFFFLSFYYEIYEGSLDLF